MKFITAVASFALMLTSCNIKESNFAIINGQYVGELKDKEIHLCKVEHGACTKVAVTTINADGQFGFNYPVDEEGLYVLNVVWASVQRKDKHDHDLKRLYLKGGTQLEVKITDGEFELLRSNSNENKLLAEWNTIADSVYYYSYGFTYNIEDYTTFFPVLDGFVDEANVFKNNINSGDADFDELMRLMVETDMNVSSLKFIYTPRGKHPERKDYPDYYDYVLSERAPQSERLLELPVGHEYLSLYSMFALLSSPNKPDASNWERESLSFIKNDLLKGYYAVSKLKKFRSYDQSYLRYKEMIEPYCLSPYLTEKLKAYEMTIRKFEKGAEAFDFAGKDINGNEHKLSDYKGNVVYVDVWATWCGPCKAEIPYLKTLERKYHGKPITFLSISIDKVKDKQKWVDFVKKEGLKGVQLLADKDFNSDVAKAYSINAIPRFMLIDKEGKIVTTDAPRPSHDNIEELLEQYL